jgi:hypothetical protein
MEHGSNTDKQKDRIFFSSLSVFDPCSIRGSSCTGEKANAMPDGRARGPPGPGPRNRLKDKYL